jgi:hypothetical protein
LEVSSAEYHQLPYLSNSRLELFDEDPEHYAAVYVHGTKLPPMPSKPKRIGSDIENWLFRGELPNIALLPPEFEGPDGRKSDAFRKWKMKQIPKKIMSLEEVSKDEKLSPYLEMASNIEQHELANHLIYESGAIVHDVIQWRDPQYGVDRMCQLDLFRENEWITDLKSSKSTNKAEWERDAYEYRYHWQAATYIDAVYELYGIDVPFYWIVIKNSPGYGVEVFRASEEQIETGRAEYRAALKRWVACRDSGNWRSPTFGLATEVGVPFYVSARGVEVIHKGMKFYVR